MVRCAMASGDHRLRHYSEATDYWSLGIVVFGLFSNGSKGVFRDIGGQELAREDAQRDILNKPPLLHKIPSQDARDFIKNCLQKEVICRLTSFKECKKHAVFEDVIWDDMTSRKCKPPQTLLELQCQPRHTEERPLIAEQLVDFTWNSEPLAVTVVTSSITKIQVETKEASVQTSPMKRHLVDSNLDPLVDPNVEYIPKKIKTTLRDEATEIERDEPLDKLDSVDDDDVVQKLQDLRNNIQKTGEEVDELLKQKKAPRDILEENCAAETLVQLSADEPVTVKSIHFKPSKMETSKCDSKVPNFENIHARIKCYLDNEQVKSSGFPKDFQLITKGVSKPKFYFKCSLCHSKHRNKVKGLYCKGLIAARVTGERFDISAIVRHISKHTNQQPSQERNENSQGDCQELGQ